MWSLFVLCAGFVVDDVCLFVLRSYSPGWWGTCLIVEADFQVAILLPQPNKCLQGLSSTGVYYPVWILYVCFNVKSQSLQFAGVRGRWSPEPSGAWCGTARTTHRGWRRAVGEQGCGTAHATWKGWRCAVGEGWCPSPQMDISRDVRNLDKGGLSELDRPQPVAAFPEDSPTGVSDLWPAGHIQLRTATDVSQHKILK